MPSISTTLSFSFPSFFLCFSFLFFSMLCIYPSIPSNSKKYKNCLSRLSTFNLCKTWVVPNPPNIRLRFLFQFLLRSVSHIYTNLTFAAHDIIEFVQSYFGSPQVIHRLSLPRRAKRVQPLQSTSSNQSLQKLTSLLKKQYTVHL